jgi:peptide/nickel transport system substrate-binding protein
MKYPLDRDRANQLLDSAGLTRGPDGNRFSLEFVHATSFAKLGELMKQHLAPIGINLELKALEVNAANDQTFIAKDFGIGVASYCNGPDPEIGVKRAYVSNNIGPILFSNGAGYRNPQVDELFDRAAASVDRQARVQAYAQIQDILVRDVPYWWLVETDNVRAWRKQYHDIFFWAGSLAEAAWLEQ